MKPRVRFCWECGRKLWGNHYKELVCVPTGEKVILHKECAKDTLFNNKNFKEVSDEISTNQKRY